MSASATYAAAQARTPLGRLTDDELRQFVIASLRGAGLEGQSVLVVVPDGTRTVPLPKIFDAVHEAVSGLVRRLTVVVALGTHRVMAESELDTHFGLTPGGWPDRYRDVERHNHAWWRPETFHTLGVIDRDQVRAISGGLLDEAIPVRVNRLAVEHDVVLIAGPVFPHEVVGFSGGTKYLFPGIGGREMIDASHWLGALIGVNEVIGAPGVTPVRELIDRAADLVPARQLCLSFVVADQESVHGAFFGSPAGAWQAAAELSARTHVEYLDRPYARVLSIMPRMYDDLWTAAKGVYKLAPVTADGGEVIVYAPHLRVLSETHGPDIRRVGYHCRDYLLAHLPELADVPRAVLAHSAHVRGDGTYDAKRGERCRIDVTLATAIDPRTCRAVKLGHRDPASIDLAAASADPDTLVVPHAGERLYRLAT